MIAFLNERSLEEYGDWSASLKLFLLAAQELSAIRARLFRDSSFFLQPNFKARFNGLGFAKDQRALIREMVFGGRYYQCWRPERLSGPADEYTCALPPALLQDESLCEAAERKLSDDASSISLVSAPDSVFARDSIIVTKVLSERAATLRNATALQTVKKWIVGERGYYDPASKAAPKDFQTILEKASDRFRATGKVERRFSRRIYEETPTGRLYYVDEAHPGGSAHLEVFSPNGQHLGTADINTAEIDPSKRVEGRVLKL